MGIRDMDRHEVKDYYRGHEIVGHVEHNLDLDTWSWRARVTKVSALRGYSQIFTSNQTFPTEAEAIGDLLRQSRHYIDIRLQ